MHLPQFRRKKPLFTNAVISLIALVVAPSFAHSETQSAANTNTKVQGYYIPPYPPGGLPTPYRGAEFKPSNPDQEKYQKYLETTALFPDLQVCEANLNEELKGSSQPDSLKWQWVTAPYMAWGGIRTAIVGPVEYLFTLTEAHATYNDMSGNLHKITFACFVQYAKFDASEVWLKNEVKYGSYMEDGFQKYISGPINIFTSAPPGTASKWNKNILYYRE